ncbi:hypothetical protein C8R46DRAFT_1213578 [Mycena filopes]|nr:hypothetical protein C8R46DRAFT_1213578 [Mycena filopes]
MPCNIADLEYEADFILGEEKRIACRDGAESFVRNYVYTDGDPMEVVVVGRIHSIVPLPDDGEIVMLKCPEMEVLFDAQERSLDDVLDCDHAAKDRVIWAHTGWSQQGHIFVQTSHLTVKVVSLHFPSPFIHF